MYHYIKKHMLEQVSARDEIAVQPHLQRTDGKLLDPPFLSPSLHSHSPQSAVRCTYTQLLANMDEKIFWQLKADENGRALELQGSEHV